MNSKNKFKKAVKTMKSGINTVQDKYDSHIRKKAVQRVNKKIQEKGLTVEQIEDDDYEAMVSDISKDIRQDYSKKASGGLLAFIGLDFLLGL